jgi:uncharacterized membrane protein SpoIIM required for sporulation
MKELQFVSRREAEWATWDRWLSATTSSGKYTPQKNEDVQSQILDNLPHAFRLLCHDLALSRDRQYSSLVQDRLRILVFAAHQRIYGARKKDGISVMKFVLHGFPALVRKEWLLVALSALLFLVPLAIMLLSLQVYPEGASLIISPDDMNHFEEMYSPTAKRLGQGREISGEWKMWGYYIGHNIKLDFQCFSGGVVFGLGAVMFLVYNGLFFGSVAGHLTQIGYVQTFWSFVVGHSAFELIGMTLSGAAGLKLGQALIAPGLLTRSAALRQNALVAIKLLTGAAALTFLAAFIEAFWSAERSLPVDLKYSVGAVFWAITLAYLTLAGRTRNEA